ncbi:MAG: hypothetical protein PVH63_10740 [Balneolaceae bacterium]|jgi:hypothetical protein
MNTPKVANNQDNAFPDLDALQDLLLVKGQFSSSEAREVLMSLINSKLSYHTKKNMRSFEHQGELDQDSQRRIEELKELRRKVLDFLKKNEKRVQGESIKIESRIHIELANDPAR